MWDGWSGGFLAHLSEVSEDLINVGLLFAEQGNQCQNR